MWLFVTARESQLPRMPLSDGIRFRYPRSTNLTPFDTNWQKGSGATPLTTQDLFLGDAISILTAPTKSKRIEPEAKARISSARSKAAPKLGPLSTSAIVSKLST